MNIYIHKNKGVMLFDSVRFITSNNSQKFNLSYIDKLKDYRIIITHGVIGEVLAMLENNFYDIDSSKIIVLCNNIETCKILQKNNVKSFNISEYIFTDDDRYSILDEDKVYDCIFPGREVKGKGLFTSKYSSNIHILYKQNRFPFPTSEMPILYNRSKVGLMTTESEGSCLSVGEMLCCGIPVVSVKINNSLPNTHFYPNNSERIYNTYDILLPNTLGGRELWLNDNNSIFCNRSDDDIDLSISELIKRDISSEFIRNDFLSKLYFERLKFLYLLKSIMSEIGLDINKIQLNQFINLPYGNSTLSSTQWLSVFNHFKNSFLI